MAKKKDIAKKMIGIYKQPIGEYLRERFDKKQTGKGSHADILKRHPALKNKYGSNYPTGYTPE